MRETLARWIPGLRLDARQWVPVLHVLGLLNLLYLVVSFGTQMGSSSVGFVLLIVLFIISLLVWDFWLCQRLRNAALGEGAYEATHNFDWRVFWGNFSVLLFAGACSLVLSASGEMDATPLIAAVFTVGVLTPLMYWLGPAEGGWLRKYVDDEIESLADTVQQRTDALWLEIKRGEGVTANGSRGASSQLAGLQEQLGYLCERLEDTANDLDSRDV
ncbi:MAG: hypothetical protein F4Y63_07140 [Chloroflexi bacterium]|nr:hypothetical protein [Chloroflexota bacterium]